MKECVSFRSKYGYQKKIKDLPAVPTFDPIDIKYKVRKHGSRTVLSTITLNMWMRNMESAIQELLENPEFEADYAYAPVKLYTNNSKENCIYSEMNTGDYWNNIIVSLYLSCNLQ